MTNPVPRGTRRPRSWWNERNRESLTAYSFLLPFFLSLLIFFGYAFIRTVYFSFTDYNLFKCLPLFGNCAGLEPDQIVKLVGANNYVDIFKDYLFRTALTNTLLFSVLVTTVQTVGALLLAIVLNQKLRGLTFFRTAYYMPSITSSVVITLIFIWLFRPTGIIAFLSTTAQNYAGPILAFVVVAVVAQAVQVLLERAQGLPAGPFDPVLMVSSILIGVIGAIALTAFGVVRIGDALPTPLTWLTTRDRLFGLIPYPLLVIMVQNTFTTIPTLMLFFLAGLQGVPKSLYEAAAIDGASPMDQLRYITVPTLRPVTFYVVTVGVIGTLQVFDQVSLFEGINAPLESTVSLGFYVYRNVFRPDGSSATGLASAAALILGALTMLVVLLQRRFIVSDEGTT